MKSKTKNNFGSNVSRKTNKKRTDEEIVEELVFRLKMRKQIREKDWKKNQYKKKRNKKTPFQLLVDNMKEIKSNGRVVGYEYKSTYPKIRIRKKRKVIEEKVGSSYKIRYEDVFVSKRHQYVYEQKKEEKKKREDEKKERIENGKTIPQDLKKRLSSFDKLLQSKVYKNSFNEFKNK
jgi:hypothetical protein